MVVVARHIVDHRVEHGRTVGEREVREQAEYHGGRLVRR
jgi:hypothetical protein